MLPEQLQSAFYKSLERVYNGGTSLLQKSFPYLCFGGRERCRTHQSELSYMCLIWLRSDHCEGHVTQLSLFSH